MSRSGRSCAWQNGDDALPTQEGLVSTMRYGKMAQARPRRRGSTPLRPQRRWWASVALLAAMGPTADVLAQDVHPPDIEIAGGYQFVAARGAPDSSGWLFSASRPVKGGFAIVGEVAELSHHESYATGELKQHWWTLLGGVRHAWRRRTVTPFVEVLGGVAFLRFCYVRRVRSSTCERLIFADAINQPLGVFQVGAGASIWITQRVGVQVAAHSQTLYESDLRGFSTLRFTTAAVIGIGNR